MILRWLGMDLLHQTKNKIINYQFSQIINKKNSILQIKTACKEHNYEALI